MRWDLLYETHSHTPLCKHAEGLPGDYARVAMEKGMGGIYVTCHGPLPDGISHSVRMFPEQFDSYLTMVRNTSTEWQGKVDVRLGLESDYLPGLEPWIEELHQRAPFDFILGSVHPHIGVYQEKYFDGDWQAFHRIYFKHLADAAETGFYDSMAHPDIIKNLGSEFWDIDALLPDIENALDRIAACGVAMELNTSGQNKTVAEMNPGPVILKMAVQRGIPFTLGADAHQPHRVGDQFGEALLMLQQAGATEITRFIARKPLTIKISEILTDPVARR